MLKKLWHAKCGIELLGPIPYSIHPSYRVVNIIDGVKGESVKSHFCTILYSFELFYETVSWKAVPLFVADNGRYLIKI